MLSSLAEAAIREGDVRLLKEMSEAAGRLGDHESCTLWGRECVRIRGELKESEWKGEDLSNATLIIHFMESEKQGLAVGINMAGYVREAAKSARRCLLIVEKRLVPLFRRTLPAVEVLTFPQNIVADRGERLVFANPLILRSVLGTSPERISGLHLPFTADLQLARRLRDRYLDGRRGPLIGISWWSSHHGKDLPSVKDWAAFLRDLPAVFVSIQYGPVEAESDVFREAAPGRYVFDPAVDQMRDMDLFASQLAALDAVVTISNTGAHLAGALGVPTFIVRDDWFRRGWPVLSDRTPWYPSTMVFGKEGRSWHLVFSCIRDQLKSMGLFQDQ